MALKGLEMILRELLRGRIGEYQHGFMTAKGCQTASEEVIKRLKGRPEVFVYEFDLKAFFNKVNVWKVCKSLEEDYGQIGQWIWALTVGNIPKINKKDIQAEEELKVLRPLLKKKKGQSYIHRFGFAQGSPLSPLLCAYALELGGIGKIPGLLMYADDGIITTEEEIKPEKYLDRGILRHFGAFVSYDKAFGRVEKKFKFLGIEYDLVDRKVSFEMRFLEDIRLSKGGNIRSTAEN